MISISVALSCIAIIFTMILLSYITKRDLIPIALGIITFIFLVIDMHTYAIISTLSIPLYMLGQLILSKTIRKLGIVYKIHVLLSLLAMLLSAIPLYFYAMRIAKQLIPLDEWTSVFTTLTLMYLLITFLINPDIKRLSFLGQKLTTDLDRLELALYSLGIIISLIVLLNYFRYNSMVSLASLISIGLIYAISKKLNLDIIILRISITILLILVLSIYTFM